jgi:hypothetical protein
VIRRSTPGKGTGPTMLVEGKSSKTGLSFTELRAGMKTLLDEF